MIGIWLQARDCKSSSSSVGACSVKKAVWEEEGRSMVLLNRQGSSKRLQLNVNGVCMRVCVDGRRGGAGVGGVRPGILGPAARRWRNARAISCTFSSCASQPPNFPRSGGPAELALAALSPIWLVPSSRFPLDAHQVGVPRACWCRRWRHHAYQVLARTSRFMTSAAISG